VFTHVTGTLQFVSGALVQLSLSFDVAKHSHGPIEIYGTEAAMQVPDPNAFGGEVKTAKPRADHWDDVPVTIPYADANYRSLGVADMAYGILNNRPHRASGELALETQQPFLVAGLDQLVHHGGSVGEADRQALLASGEAEPQSDVALASAGVADRDDVLAAFDVLRSRQLHDERLVQVRKRGEVEAA